jgi:hypothetical protein
MSPTVEVHKLVHQPDSLRASANPTVHWCTGGTDQPGAPN